MAIVTIVFGLALIGVGLIGYLPTEAPTALIPAYFGAALVVLGALALKDKIRKHAMHAAVMVGLVGFVGTAFMVIRAGLPESFSAMPRPYTMQLCMAAICGVFVVLCVKSFINARRRRQQTGS